MAVVWWALATSCSFMVLTSRRGAAAAPVSTLGGDSVRRRAQGAALDQPLCAEFEQGEQAELCGTSAGREICPSMCAVMVATPPPAEAWCEQLASRGLCSSTADLCPDVCAADSDDAAAAGGGGLSGASTRADGAAVFQTSCLVLLKLHGGCAHDLSLEDTALTPGTRVSDVCPADCSGHGKCAASALDISFLDSIDDSSGFGATVELNGGACIDGGGVSFDGGSWAAITPGHEYGSGTEFALAF